MRRSLLRSLGLSALAVLMVSCSENAADLASPGGMTAVPTTQLKLTGPTVVISQLYGGSGSAGPTFHNDFIELFNRSSSPVDVSGWSVQYASSSGTSWNAKALPANTIIPAGHYYL